MNASHAALLPAAAAALRARRPGLAARLLRAAEAAGADPRAVAMLDARRALDQGDIPAARTRLAPWPADAALLRLRAEAALAANDPARAVRDAAECVLLAPAGPDAAQDKAMLGAALLAHGNREDAAACLAEALAHSPETPALWCRLARAQPDDAARHTLAHARETHPGSADIRLESILSAMRMGEPETACALAVEACDAGLADAQILGLLGHAKSLLGRHDEAACAYEAALTLAPDDPYVRHLARAGRHRSAANETRAPADYVRAVFDGYAGRFDAHLTALGYRIPAVMRAAVAALDPGTDGPVLDLGCGTGMLATALSDLPLGAWTGVDLSPNMLRAASATGLYAALHEADVEHFVATNNERWRLILAADVFCYFGDLAAVLRGVFRCLAPGGRCLFSVETDGSGSPWSLRANGRYAHGRAGLLDAVAKAGLSTGACVPEIIRREGLGVVDGLLVTVGRPA